MATWASNGDFGHPANASDDNKLFYETEAEFDDYIETSKLGDLLKELTEACFSNRTKDPKKIIAIYCSQELYEEKKKYKNKYNKAKEVIELLNDQVEGLQNEMDVLKRNLEALRKSKQDGAKAGRIRGRRSTIIDRKKPQSLNESNDSD